jgi:hypothetical protein
MIESSLSIGILGQITGKCRSWSLRLSTLVAQKCLVFPTKMLSPIDFRLTLDFLLALDYFLKTFGSTLFHHFVNRLLGYTHRGRTKMARFSRH